MTKRYFSALFFLVCALSVLPGNAQYLHLKNDAEEQHNVERMLIMRKRLNDSLFLNVTPLSAKDAVQFIESVDDEHLSKIDQYNNSRIVSKNALFSDNWAGEEISKRPLLKQLYFYKDHFFESVEKEDYYIAINPIINYTQNMESGSGQNQFINTRGADVRARIGKKLTFYTSITDNQERAPSFMTQWSYRYQAILGQTYIKDFKREIDNAGFEYLNARGYFSVEAVKNKLNATLGFDRFKIGEGYRSLFLGDEGANFMFLNLNAKFWKLNYNNYYLELRPQYQWLSADQIHPRKYASLHHLSLNVTPWLNVGLFEGVVYSRKDRFEFQYLNPIILYRAVEQTQGSPDNALLGIDGKIHTGKNIELYAQLLFDEFKFSELRNNTGWWANKYAYQLGLKYINVAGIKNLDLQLERNYIRPFMYSYRDSLRDYSHYNQALAHPLGANLIENIAILRYQPLTKLRLQTELFIRNQGVDTLAGLSNGDNIFMNNEQRVVRDSSDNAKGYFMLTGYKQSTFLLNLNASYELRHNLFVDAGVIVRRQRTPALNLDLASNNVYVGLRLNSARRKYNL